MFRVIAKWPDQTQAETQLQFPNQEKQLLKEAFGKGID